MADGGVSEIYLAEVLDELYVAWEAYGAYVEIALVVAASYQAYESGVRAKNAYNASLRDRYVMQRTSSGQRALVLGRARTSGPIAFMQSYGSNQTTLAIVVVFAAHECDGIERIYFNDQAVILDTNWNVTGILETEHFSVHNSSPLSVFLAQPARFGTVTATAQYPDAVVALGTTLSSDGLHLTLTGARSTGVGDVTVTYQPGTCQYTPYQIADQTFTVTATSASATETFPTFSGVYVDTLVHGIAIGSAHYNSKVSAPSIVVVQSVGQVQTVLPFTLALDSDGFATSVTWTGATVGAQIVITYQSAVNFSRARIRQYLGAPGQTADARLIASLPGEWTSNHVGNGLCYVVCEFDYDQSSFSAGLPNVSAVLRGAKVFDPRTSTTAWSENPALLTRAYWTHALGAAQPAANVDDAAIITAANVCEVGAPYMVGGLARPSPLYTAGYVATRDQKPQDVLTDLCMAMGGRWVINANLLRVKAGTYTLPVAAIDASWLTGESSVVVQPLPARQSLFNTAQGTFCDERNDYRAVPYPKVAVSSLITSDGRELDLDLTYQAVTKATQAQYLSMCAIRYNRAGMTVKISCNMRAFPLEVFDVVTLTLPRFGFSAQTFEVTDTAFTPEGLIVLTLKFISGDIFLVDSSYNETAYAPKTLFPEPWNVSVPVLGTPLTGAAQLFKQTDGTIVSRIYVPLTVVDPSVLTGGFVDVSYVDSTDTSSNWSTVTVSGDSLGAYLAPVKDGHVYIIKARARNTLYASPWSTSISCQVQGLSAPPSAVSGLAYSTSGGYVTITWTPNTDADYKQTVIEYGPVGTTGNGWGTSGMAQPFIGAASSFVWASPAQGVYEFQVRHVNTSGVATASAFLSVSAPPPAAALLASALTTVTIGADGTLHGGGGGQVTLPGMGQVAYRVVSTGSSCTAIPLSSTGFYAGTSSLAGYSRSYNLATINRATGAVSLYGAYDVYAGTSAASALASALNTIGNDRIVVLWTGDEPQGNRLSGGLPAALYRCGASRAVFGSSNFAFRGAYILVGIGGCGEGNGAEAYQGAIASDPNAWCDLSFVVQNGNIIGISSTFTPKSLADYGYTGDLNATNGATFGVNVSGQVTAANSLVYFADGSLITQLLASGAATDLYQDNWSGATFSRGPTANSARSFSVTPAANCTIEFTAVTDASGVNGDSGEFGYWQVTPAGGSPVTLANMGSSSTLRQIFTAAASFVATGGVTLTFDLMFQSVPGTHSFTVNASSMRVTAVKK